MTSHICVLNAKGGVGKTTVSIALAEFLTQEFNKRVLLVDVDPQSSLSFALLGEEDHNDIHIANSALPGLLTRTLAGESLTTEDFATRIIKNASRFKAGGAPDLLPNTSEMFHTERSINAYCIDVDLRTIDSAIAANSLVNIKTMIDRFDYDFVLYDCSPSLSALTEVWLQILDYHIAPATPDQMSIASLVMLQRLRNEIISRERPCAKFLGTVPTRVKPNHKYHQDCLPLFSDKGFDPFPASIPDRAAANRITAWLDDAPSFAVRYPKADGFRDCFTKLCNQLIYRIRRLEN